MTLFVCVQTRMLQPKAHISSFHCLALEHTSDQASLCSNLTTHKLITQRKLAQGRYILEPKLLLR